MSLDTRADERHAKRLHMKALVWLGVTSYKPVCAFLEILLIVGTPLGDARRTGPINIVIGVPVAFELSAPAFLGEVVGIVQPAVRTHQPQERRLIPFTHLGASHPFVRIHIAERSVVIANVLVDPGEVRNRITSAEHPLVSLLRVNDEQLWEIITQPTNRAILSRDLMDTSFA